MTNEVWQYALKVVVSAVLIVAITEIAKAKPLVAAVVASLPLTSVLAFVWLHFETGDAERIAALSHGIFWLVLPSLALFLVLPLLLRAGWTFWPSLALACVATVVAYAGMVAVLSKLGIPL